MTAGLSTLSRAGFAGFLFAPLLVAERLFMFAARICLTPRRLRGGVKTFARKFLGGGAQVGVCDDINLGDKQPTPQKFASQTFTPPRKRRGVKQLAAVNELIAAARHLTTAQIFSAAANAGANGNS